MRKNRKGRGGAKDIIVLAVIFLIGLGIFSYPFISNQVARKQAALLIGGYERNVSNMSDQDIEEMLSKAAEYNNALIGMPVKDPFIQGSGVQLPQNYLDILNMSEVMAYIEIPKINVVLPIFHGVSEEVLSKGAGHMEGTSFPVGGSGTHCLLTGHTGLPSAKLFTDLIKMDIGDQFYIEILGKKLVYQTDLIEVIEPDELGILYTEPGEDYVTLITCTPYGVNSHRLLVRGIRVDHIVENIKLSGGYSRIYIIIFVPAVFLFLIVSGVFRRDYRKKKRMESDMAEREKQMI